MTPAHTGGTNTLHTGLSRLGDEFISHFQQLCVMTTHSGRICVCSSGSKSKAAFFSFFFLVPIALVHKDKSLFIRASEETDVTAAARWSGGQMISGRCGAEKKKK